MALGDVELKEIWIRNFKSLKDVRVKLGHFNILIGPNRAGKTNFLEALDLLRAIYFPRPGSEQVSPFLKWWGYDKVVWRRDEKLPITIGISLNVMDYGVIFETTFTGIGGAFRLLKEILEIKNIVRLEKEGKLLRVRHDRDFLDRAWENILRESEKTPKIMGRYIWPPEWKRLTEIGKEGLIEYTVEVDEQANFLRWYGGAASDILIGGIGISFEADRRAVVLSPAVTGPDVVGKITTQSLLWAVRNAMHRLLSRVLILRPVETRRLREYMDRPVKETRLSEDASNLYNVLYTFFLSRRGRLPGRVEAALRDIFGSDVSVTFDLAPDGRIYMRVYEGDLPLDPPMISDGFYKVLVVLTAIETKPSILAIDELENSLHLEAIERILDDLMSADCIVVATTHSPLVIDRVDPKDIIFVERDKEGATVMKRVPDPEALKRRLAECGVTLSEGWLYGRIV